MPMKQKTTERIRLRIRLLTLWESALWLPRTAPGRGHVSLFLIISVSRTVVQPYAVLQKEIDHYGLYAELGYTTTS